MSKVEATDAVENNGAVRLSNETVLSKDQQIAALRDAHAFFANYDRVPGFLSGSWSKALDLLAVVANSIIKEAQPKEEKVEDAKDA